MHNEVSGPVHGPVVQAGKIGHLEVYSAPAAPVARTALNGLPTVTGTFAGRARHLAELAAGEGLTVVSGLGGVGKTELLLRYGHRSRAAFPGGFLYVDLHGYDPQRRVEPTRALSSFLRALGVRADDIPPEEGERAALFRTEMARRDRILVLLDNASSAAQVWPLLVDRHRVVVSSRNTLASLGDEHPVELDVLTRDEALELVGDPELAELCGRLPLALRIMAALRKADPAADWPAELRETRLDVLDDGDSQAVHATFRLSYDSLDADQRRFFRLLALHPGDEIGVDGAAALADLPKATAGRLLRELRTAHLVEARYRFHDLVRLYALRCLDEEGPGDRNPALERMIGFYAGTAGRQSKGIHARRCDADALRWMDAHHRAVTAVAATANDLGRDEDVVVIAEAMHSYFSLRKHMSEWFGLQRMAVAAARRLGDRRGVAKALNRLGTIHRQARQFDEAIAHGEEALRINEELGDQIGVGGALIMLASTYRNMGRPELSLPHCERSLRIRRAIDDPRGLGISLTNLGATYRDLGRPDEAIACYDEALALQRRKGEEGGESVTLLDLGKAYQTKGDLHRSVEYYVASLDIHRRRDDRFGAGVTLMSLGTAYRELGRTGEARTAYREALAAFEEVDADHEARQIRALAAELGR